MREHSAQTAKAPVLQARAMDNLDFIHSTMERASALSTVSGWGNVAIGCSALTTAPIVGGQATDLYFLLLWLTKATLALGPPALIADIDRQSYHIITLDAFMRDLPTGQKHTATPRTEVNPH